MPHNRSGFLYIAILLAASILPTSTFGQTVTTAEWSTRIWAAASEGNWNAVDSLLNDVPQGEDKQLASFRNQLNVYRTHREVEAQNISVKRDIALAEMNTYMEEGNVVKAMQSAVEAQTLSKNLDDIMLQKDVQAVLSKTQDEIDTLSEDGNILTA